MGLESPFHIRCAGNPRCSFRVHDRYFMDKKQFIPGNCPNCGSAIDVVLPYTDIGSSTHHLGIDPNVTADYRRVVPNVVGGAI